MVNRDIAGMREDYSSDSLSRAQLDADPLAQFNQWFELAADSKVREPNAMALATVDGTGMPSCRIVLLKGVDHGFVFFTNYASRKGRQLHDNNHAAVTFWWDAMHRQVRIEGEVEKVSTQESDEYFYSRPQGSQVSASISPQSEVIESCQQLLDLKQAFDIKTLKRPEHWGGYRLIPSRMEFWQGRQNRLHDRFVYQKQTDKKLAWLISRLAP